VGDEKLSVVIPAYNEERYIGALLEKVLAADLGRPGLAREVIVVDDCSTDRTAEIAAGFVGVIVHRRPRNAGKGEAVKTGIRLASGEYLIIQDADLEYDPRDYAPMLEALIEGRLDAVYGSRYLQGDQTGPYGGLPTGKHPGQTWPAYLGGRSLSLVAWLLLGRYLTDTVTALKLFRTEVVKPLDLSTRGFELDHEISAKLLARGCRIGEVPIRYFPRSRAEGKKIGLGDWFRAVYTFARYRSG